MRFVKGLFAILSWAVLISLITIIGSKLEHPTLGVMLGLWVASLTVNAFIISVPKVTGALSTNAITGKLTPYGTGLSFKFPWEQVEVGDHINLRIVTESMEETYPAEDGPIMQVKWSFQYKPKLKLLERYISSDDHTIKDGIKEVGSSILSATIALHKADDCKAKQHEIEQELHAAFANANPKPEDLYGIELIRVSLADVDYEPTVQAVRATQQVAKKLKEIAKDIQRDHQGISDKDAMNMAMVAHGKIKKDIVEVEGQGGEALSALLIAASRGGKS